MMEEGRGEKKRGYIFIQYSTSSIACSRMERREEERHASSLPPTEIAN